VKALESAMSETAGNAKRAEAKDLRVFGEFIVILFGVKSDLLQQEARQSSSCAIPVLPPSNCAVDCPNRARRIAQVAQFPAQRIASARAGN
jgi:hypothetical protein